MWVFIVSGNSGNGLSSFYVIENFWVGLGCFELYIS